LDRVPDSDGNDATGEWSEPLAAAWERNRERLFQRHRQVSDWLVDAIAPQPGQTILELAAGPGETGFLAAERVGPAGKLISTDVTPGMVEAAERGARARGLRNVDCRIMDAQQIELPDVSVDGVLCRFALMLMPKQLQVLGEVRRVLRAGGRLAYAVFGSADQNPWMTRLVGAIEQAGYRLPGDPFGPGGPFFSLATPRWNQDLLEQAGFTDVQVETIAEPRSYRDFDEYWEHHTQATGPIAALISSIPAEAAQSIRASLEPTLAEFKTAGGYQIPSLVVVARAG
jgi:ubiquinone/menaquinone biosynthesis C-methylase UbiE